MSETILKQHPTLGILVCSDGHIMVPRTRYTKAHYTFGSSTDTGYKVVHINGKRYRVHRLVLETFVGPCPDGMECDHSDRNRRNNALTNLRWLPRTQNNRNTSKTEAVNIRGGTHYYDSVNDYNREWNRDNPEKRKAALNKYNHSEKGKQSRVKFQASHKNILFADGKRRWVPNSEADKLLKIPVKDRSYDSF